MLGAASFALQYLEHVHFGDSIADAGHEVHGLVIGSVASATDQSNVQMQPCEGMEGFQRDLSDSLASMC